ncbi:MAG: hypothetical protein AB7R40_25995, partial [Nitrospiraceae bacterium]
MSEMVLIRGIVFSHEAVRDWEAELTPVLAETLRCRRCGKVGWSWYVDEVYLKQAPRSFPSGSLSARAQPEGRSQPEATRPQWQETQVG